MSGMVIVRLLAGHPHIRIGDQFGDEAFVKRTLRRALADQTSHFLVYVLCIAGRVQERR